MKSVKAALGIEIRDEEIRLACLVRSMTRPKVVAAASFPFSAKDLSTPGRTEEGIAAIRQFIRGLSLQLDRVVVGFSRKRVFMRTLQLPWVEAEDLPRTVEFQMEGHIPIPLREVHLAFKVLTSDRGAGIRAITVAIQRSQLEQYLTLLARAGLMADQVTATPFVKAHLSRRSDSGFKKGRVQVILEKEGNDYALEALWGGQLFLASVFTPTGPKTKHYEEFLEHLAEQFDMAGISWDPRIDEDLSFFYVGSPPEFFEELPVNWRPLTAGVALPSSLDLDLSSYPGAFGLAFQGLGYFDDKVNLIYSRPAVPSRRALAPFLGIAAGIAVAILLAFFIKDYLTLGRQLEQLKSQAEKLRPAVLEVQSLARQLNQVNAQLEEGNRLATREKSKLELLNELATTLPANAWFTQFSYKEGQIEIKGQATSSQELVQLLERSPLVENVRFDAPITRREAFELFSMKADLEGYSRK